MEPDPLDSESAAVEGPRPPDPHGPAPHSQQQRADEREHSADDREAVADERERIADEREAAADERERAADEREAFADGWQTQLAGREKRLDERSRASGEPTVSLQQRAYEEIDRAQSLLAASQDRLTRTRAAVDRSASANRREQGTIDRETAISAARAEAQGPSVRALEAETSRLRDHAAAALEKLAEAEDALADTHAQHNRAEQAAQHRTYAEQARTAARDVPDDSDRRPDSGQDRT
ncbi:hypothetical protein ABZ916_35125 [Streptomyces sp. NPDC046853]|uniref:hypothetical protein n=1 Tax=Streptomyces sp. NPDC046853 TaxID=3154920 RepID=UPI0033C7FAB3